jgi:plastocyanin domain-containing protein
MQQIEIAVWGGLIMSIIGMSIGLPLTLSFLKHNPVIEGDDE